MNLHKPYIRNWRLMRAASSELVW